MSTKQSLDAERLRWWAFTGSALATMGTLICVVVMPLIYEHIQQVHTIMLNEVDFCKARSANVFSEIRVTKRRGASSYAFDVLPESKEADYENVHNKKHQPQPPAEAPYDILNSPVVTPADNAYTSTIPPAANYLPKAEVSPKGCCGCGHSPAGPPGLPGKPGDDGRDGEEGTPGRDGLPGRDRPPAYAIQYCFDCPPGDQGAPGAAGEKGRNGLAGFDGHDSQKAIPGHPGSAGFPGAMGPVGEPGERGEPGIPGRLQDMPIRTGPPGPIGPPGRAGERGQPGTNGTPGRVIDGQMGEMGDPGKEGIDGDAGPQGPPGPTGLDGACDHCNVPKTPPGY